MSSRYSTNRRLNGAVLAAGLTAAFAAGCGKTTGGGTQPNGGPAARQLAYVRLDELVLRHPLQAEIGRLQAARTRLLHLLPAAAPHTGVAESYTLPPLATREDAAAAPRVARQLETARQRARAVLLAQAAMQLDSFLRGVEYRQDMLLEQRRAELEAQGQAEQQRQIGEIREEEAGNVRAQVQALGPELVNRQVPVTVLRAQLDPKQAAYALTPGEVAALGRLAPANPQPVSLMPPAPDRQTLQEEIRKLQEDPKTPGISMRARYGLKLRQAREKLNALLAEIDSLNQRGRETVDARIQALRDARLAEIATQLEAIRSNTEGLVLATAQRKALNRTLETEAALSARTAQDVGRSRSNVAGRAEYASLFGAEPGAALAASRTLDVQRAVTRVDEQTKRLQKYIAEDVRDAVQDAADAHRVEVTYAPDPRREDMTARFAAWTGLAGTATDGAATSAAGG